MGVTTINDSDRLRELKAFDDTKAGVKGLVDEGILKIPTLFHHPPDKFLKATNSEHIIPIIDLANAGKDPNIRQQVISRIREACETWGFFQVVNHGIPVTVLEDMKDGVHRFYEQDTEVKKELYTRDQMKPVRYNSNFDLYSSPALNWRDTFVCNLAPNAPKPQDLPLVCRDILLEYGDHVMKLGILLYELLSEALGLHPDHLKDMGCAEGIMALCHYYPACPEPELTMGTTKHSDSSFLTVLLQDHIGGLQVLYQDKLIDIPPLPEALVVNIGDPLQSLAFVPGVSGRPTGRCPKTDEYSTPKDQAGVPATEVSNPRSVIDNPGSTMGDIYIVCVTVRSLYRPRHVRLEDRGGGCGWRSLAHTGSSGHPTTLVVEDGHCYDAD